MVRPFIFPALTIWGTRGTLVLCLSERQPFFAALTQRGELRSAKRGRLPQARLGQRRTHGGGQKGRDTYGFPSSLNSCLSLIC